MCVTRFLPQQLCPYSKKDYSVIDMAKIQINSETILFLKIFLFGKSVFY